MRSSQAIDAARPDGGPPPPERMTENFKA